MGDLNINILYNTKDHYNFLSHLCDTFSLNNLIKEKTSADVMLTNRPKSFHKTSIIETGFSDQGNMIPSFFRTNFERLKSKKLE